MNKISLLALILCAIFINATAQTENPKYNKALADSLGADQYGMKMYYLVILKTGTNQTTDKEKVNSIFRGHMDNITRLANEGKLVVAGPLGKNENQYRGIFIFAVKTKKEIEDLLQTDPAIKEKILAPEIYEWYGSAALPKYLEYHDKIEKSKH